MSDIERYMREWGGALADLEGWAQVPFNRDTDFDERTRLVEGAPVYSPFISHGEGAWRNFFQDVSAFGDDFIAERDNAVPQERKTL